MKIDNIKVENYRLLKDFSIDLEDELSLVVGKNNTGKTSLLTVMDKFLNGSDKANFSFDDFNIDLKNKIKALVEEAEVNPVGYLPVGIGMKLLIKYDDKDNLANVSRVMMDLDPEHYYILLEFRYTMDFENLMRLKEDFAAFRVREEAKVTGNAAVAQEPSQGDKKDIQDKEDLEASRSADYQVKNLFYYLRNNLEYFRYSRRSLSCSKEDGKEDNVAFIDMDKEKISLKNIVNFKYISAKRDVTNRDMDKTLSSQTSKIYEKTEGTDDQNSEVEKFKDKLIDTDTVLSDVYKDLFKEVINKVSRFGGIKEGDTQISIESTLQHRDLLSGNTTVMYNHGEHSFPEYNNGLGYMNLISIIFEIEIQVQEFKRNKNEVPADINFLFIEEPEAHTHPQMQYVFINNIKSLLKEGVRREDGENRKLQYIISTHSSHIVSESDFNDIRYLKRVGETSVITKSLKSLEIEYSEDGEEKNYKFLKQYLTLNKAELFFADKAILVEGDTERILLPAMMKKIDQEHSENPMLSQNISVVEVGAHSQVFEKFIDFIGVKTLIVTDLDSAEVKIEDEKTKRIACKVDDANATVSTNGSLKFFLNTDLLNEIKGKNFAQKCLKKIDDGSGAKKWLVSDEGYVQIVCQTEEVNASTDTYHARSFEDAFAHVNWGFLTHADNEFASLTEKHFKKFRAGEIGVYDFADKALGSKPSFAIEILLNSKQEADGKQFINWNTTSYIVEGLMWLRED